MRYRTQKYALEKLDCAYSAHPCMHTSLRISPPAHAHTETHTNSFKVAQGLTLNL